MTTTDYREPTDAEIATVAAHPYFCGDLDKARSFARRFPPAVGIEPNPGTAAAAKADQLEAALTAGHDLVAEYLTNVAPHLLVVAFAAERFRKLRLVAGKVKPGKHKLGSYDRAFSAPLDRPEALPTGLTVPTKTEFNAHPMTGDTRVYAVLARVPDYRVPVATRDDLVAFVAEARKLRFCDIQLKGALCDGAIWSEPVLVPFMRGDAIVFVSVCHFCWKAYCEKHGVSAGEIIDPDDVVD